MGNMKKTDPMTRELIADCIRQVEGEGNERKFRISFSSETPYTRWFGDEILDHSEGCVDMTRLEQNCVILFNHDKNMVLGKATKVWIENNRGEAEIEFDTDAEAEKIYQKVKNGTLKGISVGYRVEVFEEVKVNHTSADGRFTGPCHIAKLWEPYEISIVSIPADITVGIGRGMEDMTDQSETGCSLSVYERQIIINKNREVRR